MSPAEYAAMPKELKLREIRVRIKERNKRTRVLVIVTTLLDATKYPASALGDLFRQRWHAELDLRSIKTTMGMEMLRTKTPDMVRKEVGMHLLAYNLIRGVMAEAARGRDIVPRELSFNGARQTVRAFEETHLYEPNGDRRGFSVAVGPDQPEAGRRSTGPMRIWFAAVWAELHRPSLAKTSRAIVPMPRSSSR